MLAANRYDSFGLRPEECGTWRKNDFDKCFDILRKNREIYNLYNDSIFQIKEHDKWVNFFRHRALKNQQIFLANRQAINVITDYFEKDPERKDTAACSELYHALEETIWLNLLPILLLPRRYIIFSKNMIRYCLPKKTLLFINRLKSWVNRSVWDMVKDTTYLRDVYRSNLLLTSQSLKGKHLDINSLLGAYVDFSNTILLRNGLQSLQEYRNALDSLRAIVNDPAIMEKALPGMVQLGKNRLQTADEDLLRNVYLTDSTVLDKRWQIP